MDSSKEKYTNDGPFRVLITDSMRKKFIKNSLQKTKKQVNLTKKNELKRN